MAKRQALDLDLSPEERARFRRWLDQEETKWFLQAVGEYRGSSVQALETEQDPPLLYRLQGEIRMADRILGLTRMFTKSPAKPKGGYV